MMNAAEIIQKNYKEVSVLKFRAMNSPVGIGSSNID